jgi:hypothetical protein
MAGFCNLMQMAWMLGEGETGGGDARCPYLGKMIDCCRHWALHLLQSLAGHERRLHGVLRLAG